MQSGFHADAVAVKLAQGRLPNVHSRSMRSVHQTDRRIGRGDDATEFLEFAAVARSRRWLTGLYRASTKSAARSRVQTRFNRFPRRQQIAQADAGEIVAERGAEQGGGGGRRGDARDDLDGKVREIARPVPAANWPCRRRRRSPEETRATRRPAVGQFQDLAGTVGLGTDGAWPEFGARDRAGRASAGRRRSRR